MKSKDIDSLDLIREFLNTKDALYCEIELIIFALCVAAVTISVESIIESYISVYESRNSKIRPITEEHAHHEMIIAINGPELCNADNVKKKSMSNYWNNQKRKDGWHFTRRSEDINCYTVSKVVDRLSSQNPSLPFMV